MDYLTIKTLAKENGLRVKDLCALAPANDPFYVGRPSDVEQGQWFYNLWQQFGFAEGVHLRRIHYRLVAYGDITKPNGEVYENTDKDWAYLNNAAKNARYMGLVDPASFVDRRNPDPVVRASWLNPGDEEYLGPDPYATINPAYGDEWEESYYQAPLLPDFPTPFYALPSPPNYTAHGYNVQQDYHLEIWCEKSTMNDVFIPLCEQYGANLVTGLGEMSITAVLELMYRVHQSQRPARILYVSDYDPAGHGMPVSVSRKIEYFQKNKGFSQLDIKLYPVCLTIEQVNEYSLPRVPSKESDKRKKHWDAVHGQGVVELDALEALYPGELSDILAQHLKQWYDLTLPARANSALNEFDYNLDQRRDDILDEYQDRLKRLSASYATLKVEWAELGEEFEKLMEPLEDRASAIAGQINDLVAQHKELCQEIETDLDHAYDEGIETPPIPEPDLPPDPTGLYQSNRGYIEQIHIYKNYRNGTSQEALL